MRGEQRAIQLVLDKLYASPKDRAVTFELPPIRTPVDIPLALDAIMQAASAGQLTPGEAASLSATVVDFNGKIMSDVYVYLRTVKKLIEADDKPALAALKAPYPSDVDAP
jgi:hypothetical protein